MTEAKGKQKKMTQADIIKNERREWMWGKRNGGLKDFGGRFCEIVDLFFTGNCLEIVGLKKHVSQNRKDRILNN
jgi:hypothetical protein